MYKQIPGLVLYRDLGEDSILYKLADIFRDKDYRLASDEELVSRIYQQIKRLLDVATSYGFNRNLWQDYLAFLLIMPRIARKAELNPPTSSISPHLTASLPSITEPMSFAMRSERIIIS